MASTNGMNYAVEQQTLSGIRNRSPGTVQQQQQQQQQQLSSKRYRDGDGTATQAQSIINVREQRPTPPVPPNTPDNEGKRSRYNSYDASTDTRKAKSFISTMGSLAAPPPNGNPNNTSTGTVGLRRNLSGSLVEQFLSSATTGGDCSSDDKMEEDPPFARSMSF